MRALICGTGALPATVAEASETKPLICVLDGFAPDRVQPDLTFRLEHLGSLLKELKDKGVTDVCLCGAIKRPQIEPSQIDAATLPCVPIMMRALGQGDDGALRAVIGIFESQGFAVCGAHEITPGLLPPPGLMTKTRPSQDHTADITAARAVLQEMGQADLGQACIVAGAAVRAREGADGTDAMLATVRDDPSLAGGLLYKGPKPNQDRRADLPTIGPDTVTRAAQAGLAGIVIEAGGVIVLERSETAARADALGLFVWVVQQ